MYDATVNKVPPAARTKTHMGVLERGVRHYFAIYRVLPSQLDGFVGTEACDARYRRDGGGWSIEYRVNRTTVTLTSSGPDGAMGRGGDDIVQTFDAADPR
ncbi:MAG: hypothetical protein JSS51_04670 [Planctomycetes bacterium]|nr:hypothetical protein [Planctomycetota bacterium]